jgi:hypothetical protein
MKSMTPRGITGLGRFEGLVNTETILQNGSDMSCSSLDHSADCMHPPALGTKKIKFFTESVYVFRQNLHNEQP